MLYLSAFQLDSGDWVLIPIFFWKNSFNF